MGLGIRITDSLNLSQRDRTVTSSTTYTEYFVSDGVGGYEQANDSTLDPLYVKE